MSEIGLLIPAYKPSDGLYKLMHELRERGGFSLFSKVVIVDDGSGLDFRSLFDKIVGEFSVELRRNAINLGKGAALKAGFNHILVNYPLIHSIITADADGQHAAEDIIRIGETAKVNPSIYFLGSRLFGKDVPLRSNFGNEVTRKVLWFFTGLHLKDTQTGLRAWPKVLCLQALKISTNGYDFEMDCLVSGRKRLKLNVPIREVPIRTIYEEGNPTSHFNPLLDSMRVYFVFIRYSSVSFISVFIDYFIFFLISTSGFPLWVSIAGGRLAAVFIAFGLSKKLVFRSEGKVIWEFVRYISVLVIFAVIVYYAIQALNHTFGINIFIAKIISESILFFIGFILSNVFIFAQKKDVDNVTIAK